MTESVDPSKTPVVSFVHRWLSLRLSPSASVAVPVQDRVSEVVGLGLSMLTVPMAGAVFATITAAESSEEPPKPSVAVTVQLSISPPTAIDVSIVRYSVDPITLSVVSFVQTKSRSVVSPSGSVTSGMH